MDKNYFEANVVFAVEVEFEIGGRNWRTVVGQKALDEYLNRLNEFDDMWLSDIDYASKQPDKKVRKVLNTAWYNFRNNSEWCKKHGLTSLWSVVDYIIEENLA